jgi:chaperonin GroEL
MPMDRQYFKQNMSPKITFDGTVSHTLEKIAQDVGATYGPFGTFNLFKNGPDVTASKDGFENVTMMKFEASIARMVHNMVIELASHQAFTVGDGTTSAILVLASIYKELMSSELLRSKYTPTEINNATRDIQTHILNGLTSNATALLAPEEALAIIYTSVDANQELTKTLMELYNTVDNLQDKNILLDRSANETTYIKTAQGINVKGKLMSNAFANLDMDNCNLRNADVIIVDGKAEIGNDILNHVMQLQKQERSLLIMCAGVNEGFVRYVEIMSKTQPHVLKNMAVVYSYANTVADKDLFYDVAKSVGGIYLEENSVISAETLPNIIAGHVDNVLIKDRKITLGGFNPSPEFDTYLEALKTKLQDLIDQEKSGTLDSEEQMTVRGLQAPLRGRIETLTHGVTTIYVGGDTSQRKSIMYRLVEDGLKALQSAMKYGYTDGCNTMVMNLLAELVGFEAEQENAGLYLELAKCILNAYINVYKRIILNRKKLTDAELMQSMMTPEGFQMYDANTDTLNITKKTEHAIFLPVDLRPRVDGVISPFIINPVQIDLNIVQRAIDSALILATSNTVFVEDMEFEA